MNEALEKHTDELRLVAFGGMVCFTLCALQIGGKRK